MWRNPLRALTRRYRKMVPVRGGVGVSVRGIEPESAPEPEPEPDRSGADVVPAIRWVGSRRRAGRFRAARSPRFVGRMRAPARWVGSRRRAAGPDRLALSDVVRRF